MGGVVFFVSFPGVTRPERASMTLSHGITPSCCTIECEPQEDFIGEGGLLAFVYGSIEFGFSGCKVDRASLRYDSSGFVIGLTILDRRWKWAFGGPGGAGNGVSGSYNSRKDDGSLWPDRLKAPQDLLALCLDAMGEQNYDVSAVPNDTYPPVEWENENPAQALANLADELGCRVVLRLDETVAVMPVGYGGILPSGPGAMIESDSLTIDPPEQPDALAVVCGRTRYQARFALRAVGLDTDGQIKLIDNLSYTPPRGWAKADIYSFLDVDPANPVNSGQRDLAKLTVWRWYVVALGFPNPATGELYTVDIPGFGVVDDLRRIAPLLDEQVESLIDVDGKLRALPPGVQGRFYDERYKGSNTSLGTNYRKGFSVDAAHGIVQFDDQVYLIDTSGGSTQGNLQEPQLTLLIGVNVRETTTWGWQRHVRRLDFGTGYGTGAKLYRHDEIEKWVKGVYDFDGNVTGLLTNEADVNVEADAYLAAALAEFQTTLPQEVAYAGLVPISLDGAIQQVSWQMGPEGCTTRASRNSEFAAAVPEHKTRRFFEVLRGKVGPTLQKVIDLDREVRLRPKPY